MRINTNHPSFVTFFNNVNTVVIAHSPIENYFDLPLEKKTNTLYVIFKLIKSTLHLRTKLNDEEIKAFIDVMWKKNEELENYEFAAALRDISNNFNSINESTRPKRKSSKNVKTAKIDKSTNG